MENNPNYLKLIYVCSPYAGDTERNIKFAEEACRHVVCCGHAFFAPHLLYPKLLDDSIPEERNCGLLMGMTLLARCDELWVFGGTISSGMQAEIDAARYLGIPVRQIILQKDMDRPTCTSPVIKC